MKRSTLFILIFMALSIIQSYAQDAKGVWANADCELLRTGQTALFFERDGNQYMARFLLYQKNAPLRCKAYAEIRFTDTLKTYEKIRYHCDSVLEPWTVGVLENDQLTIKGLQKRQKLRRIEEFDLSGPWEMAYADSSRIGTCLQQWMLGTSLEKDSARGLFRFMAGTNRHSYMFDLQKGFTYCRAARIKSCNLGTYLSQNIRIYDDGTYKMLIFEHSNHTVAAAQLIIDKTLFDPNACHYVKNGFYWSLIRFGPENIVLNGCQAEYEFHRPVQNSQRLLEWIRFKP